MIVMMEKANIDSLTTRIADLEFQLKAANAPPLPAWVLKAFQGWGDGEEHESKKRFKVNGLPFEITHSFGSGREVLKAINHLRALADKQ